MNGPRAAAAQAVAACLGGQSLDRLLPILLAAYSAADQSLIKAIVYGVVREHRLLGALLAPLLQKPLKNEPLVDALLRCGVFQLRAMRVPAHAAVGESVAAAQQLGKPWAKGLVNAVLRRYQREQAALEAAVPAQPAIRESYPDWLVAALDADWPQQAAAILAAGNVPGPLTLRVNIARDSLAAAAERLAAAGHVVHAVPGVATALRLETPVAVERLPGFAEGLLSVQDASAQLAAGLLGVQPGQRVLDACAAPGGKTAHLLESCAALELVALDNDAQRLRRVHDNLERLQLQAHCVVGDAGAPQRWWDGRAFDAVLLDAPCSGSGVIRRHPDIKWLRRDSDLPTLAAQQQRLLAALWPTLRPGGVLLYVTCSIFSVEGEAVISAFLAAQPDARAEPLTLPSGETTAHGWRLAPGGDFDGFYYARLRKAAP